MFTKILIANRGEIAVRVIRACREMGIATVAVFSEVDRQALHVLQADQAVCLGPAQPAQSYLNMDRIIEAALETGAQAVHPGYGFLAENGVFAERCRQAGLTFIGPPPEVIQDLGDKTTAREIMRQAGVPVIPGTVAQALDLDRAAAEIGCPLLVKAAAGGGGKGMRLVENPRQLPAAWEAASKEAEAAFGNGAVYLEKCLTRPRHVEFQILADSHGQVVHLLERECSIQRRHQKIIEESPSPALDPGLRQAMGQAAVTAARASGYVNAGTVEFLLDEDGRFYFLEVNTRLQVEHPVTEMVTGLDLVRRQIEIAAALPLDLDQADIFPRGHAMECRIYGEDPANDFFPSPGRILALREPSGPGVRNDSGIYPGFEVPMEYDPILSKLIVWAETRDRAVARMIQALEDYVILGVTTPIPFLLDILKSPAFQEGETHTGFIPLHFPDWRPGYPEAELAALAAVAAELSGPDQAAAGPGPVRDRPVSPWQRLGSWRI